MQAVYFLLLAVYASIATAETIITYSWASNWNGTSRDNIKNAMDLATEFYNVNTKWVGTQHAVVDYDPNHSQIVVTRYPPMIIFPSDKRYHQSYVGIWAISHVLGVGRTQAYAIRCKPDKVLHWGEPQRLLNTFKGYEHATLGCNSENFWPFGLGDGREHGNSNNALKHVLLVEAMVKRGLQR